MRLETANWHQRATQKEIDEVATIDQSIADLRRRRKTIINRTKFRTAVWIARHRNHTQPAPVRSSDANLSATGPRPTVT